tara:strand:- start:54 stop:641 length:588 start_codon:yes stop_codon:yes gene_type:complete
MKVIGLTGGIGSGKSTVANMFKELGVPVYIADDEAKKIMLTNKVKNKIISLLGENSYLDNRINKTFIASKVFNNKELLEKLNKIVHPAVALDFLEWSKKQKGPYVIKEAAVLFENEGYKKCDLTILVVADEKTRIQRVLKRDSTTESKIKERIENQWPDSKKLKLADFIIKNNEGLPNLKSQVYKIHEKLINLSS